MAIRTTTKFVNQLAAGMSLREILAYCTMYLYSQSQPADADDGPNGIQCVRFTLDGLAVTTATSSSGSITIGGGGTGGVDSVSVGGMGENLLAAVVPYDTSFAQTAIDVAASINSKQNSLGITAEAVGNDVILYAAAWLGTDADGLTVAAGVSGTTTAAPSNFAGGVDNIGGLNFEFPADGGIIVKPSAEVWKGLGLADDNVGWFRIVENGGSVSGDGADNSRIDGLVATSGGDLQTGSNVITLGAVQTIGTLSIVIPRVKV